MPVLTRNQFKQIKTPRQVYAPEYVTNNEITKLRETIPTVKEFDKEMQRDAENLSHASLTHKTFVRIMTRRLRLFESLDPHFSKGMFYSMSLNALRARCFETFYEEFIAWYPVLRDLNNEAIRQFRVLKDKATLYLCLPDGGLGRISFEQKQATNKTLYKALEMLQELNPSLFKDRLSVAKGWVGQTEPLAKGSKKSESI